MLYWVYWLCVILVRALWQNPSVFIQQVLNGLQLGFIYALIALGYTMVYGIVKLINFAHGDVFMIGAFTSFYAIATLDLHRWVAWIIPERSRDAGRCRGNLNGYPAAMVDIWSDCCCDRAFCLPSFAE